MQRRLRFCGMALFEYFERGRESSLVKSIYYDPDVVVTIRLLKTVLSDTIATVSAYAGQDRVDLVKALTRSTVIVVA